MLSRSQTFLLGSFWLLASCATPKTTPQPTPVTPATAATTVYIVRHAEKDPTPGLTDPALSALGAQRALALRDTMVTKSLAAIFSTATTRTRSTAEPVATKLQVPVQLYNPTQLAALASRIRREYRGRGVLVVGHSNTILETVEALGAARPVPTISDADYHYLLQVTFPADTTKAPTAVARHYGTN